MRTAFASEGGSSALEGASPLTAGGLRTAPAFGSMQTRAISQSTPRTSVQVCTCIHTQNQNTHTQILHTHTHLEIQPGLPHYHVGLLWPTKTRPMSSCLNVALLRCNPAHLNNPEPGDKALATQTSRAASQACGLLKGPAPAVRGLGVPLRERRRRVRDALRGLSGRLPLPPPPRGQPTPSPSCCRCRSSSTSRWGQETLGKGGRPALALVSKSGLAARRPNQVQREGRPTEPGGDVAPEAPV